MTPKRNNNNNSNAAPHTMSPHERVRPNIRNELVALLKLDLMPHEIYEKFWVVEDFRDVLVESGVDERITTSDLRSVLVEMHQSGLISHNKWRNKHHYCLDPSTKDTPMDQEHMCRPAPVPNFWLSSAEGTKVVDALGEELDKIFEEEEKDDENKKQPAGEDSTNKKQPAGEDSTNLPLCYECGVPSGYRVIKNFQLGRLLHWSFNHRSHCKHPVGSNLCLNSFKKDGFASVDCYSCTGCNEKHVFQTSPHVKTPVTAKGRKYSRPQAAINVSAPASLRLAGLNAKQSTEFFGEADIMFPATKNLMAQLNKVHTAILREIADMLVTNRRKVIAAVLSSPSFDKSKDILKWHDTDGVEHNTVKVTAMMDAAGPTRNYNNRSTGTQSAACLIAEILQLPIAMKVSRTGCMKCVHAMHAAMKAGERNPGLFLGKHEGECTSNSMNGPSVAEEFMLEEMGRDLLLDCEGTHLGDLLALFICYPTSDGDSKGANRLINKQAEIIGEEAEGQSQTLPCATHTGKNLNKSFYTLRKKDPSFRGIGGLENSRISAVGWDVKQCLKELKTESWDLHCEPTAAQVAATEKRILNVFPHHCGDHSGCTDGERCGFIKMKLEKGHDIKQELSKEQTEALLEEMVEKGYSRFEYSLQLNQKGMVRVLHEVTLRYNRKSIPTLAKCHTTNQVESLWNQVIKYSQGKRLNQNYSELWEVGVGIAVLNKSDPSKFILSLFTSLGLPESTNLASYRKKREHRRAKDRAYHQSDTAKATRRRSKVVKSNMGRKPKSEYKYKPEKVHPGEEVSFVRTKTARPCKNCSVLGHTASKCNLPRKRKREELMIDSVWLDDDSLF